MTLRLERSLELPVPIPPPPPSLSVLSPGIGGAGPESLVFFDLETTGLSTAAGTLAFLAAFGLPERSPAGERGTGGGPYTRIKIIQYLLLDYPGEAGFLEALAGEFRPSATLVSYNGKSFDSQILNNRCLMNGMALPGLNHVDLLYSARRLWKTRLPNCSQGTVEREILSLDRDGDLSGAFAPDAWFSFLRSGDAAALLRICDHNARDILGLASLFGCLCRIAADPLGAGERYSADLERLAFLWQRSPASGAPEAGDQGREAERARALLERGAALGYPRCCRKLAIEAEWRGGDISRALGLVDRALARNPPDSPGPSPAGRLPEWLRRDLEGRRKRLLAKAAPGS
jgi:uncharacterized protein YprB with RNaseH-like and TPR domain